MPPTFGARPLGRAGGLLRGEEGVRRETRKGSRGLSAALQKAVYNSDSLASSLWTDALISVHFHRRRQRSCGTSCKKRFGTCLRNAHAASRRSRLAKSSAVR